MEDMYIPSKRKGICHACKEKIRDGSIHIRNPSKHYCIDSNWDNP